MTHQVDEIDLKMLAILQEHGRITNLDLARRVGISPPPCDRRRQELEARGYIHRYRAEVDATKVGYAISAFVLIGLAAQTDRDVREFDRIVRGWSSVRAAYAIAGSGDFLLHCCTRNIGEFQTFVTQSLMKCPKVRNVRSHLVMRTLKKERNVPISDIVSRSLTKRDPLSHAVGQK